MTSLCRRILLVRDAVGEAVHQRNKHYKDYQQNYDKGKLIKIHAPH